MALTTLPDNWSPAMLEAFNALNDAAFSYMVYDQALSKLGINDPVLVQRRTDVGNLIKNVLGPAFKASQ